VQRNIHSPDMRGRNGSIIVLSIIGDAEKLNTGRSLDSGGTAPKKLRLSHGRVGLDCVQCGD
jgi:hypothetical protein